MKLLNIRLGPQDSAMVKALRQRGVQISTLVRGAIRAAYHGQRPPAAGDVESILRELYARYPDPPGLRPLQVSPRDRRAVRDHIRRRLRGRGS
jgi:hypothetical protein